jgi:hypothetical protein
VTESLSASSVRCAMCGYALQASLRCAECGRVYASEADVQVVHSERRAVRRLAGWGLPGLVIVVGAALALSQYLLAVRQAGGSALMDPKTAGVFRMNVFGAWLYGWAVIGWMMFPVTGTVTGFLGLSAFIELAWRRAGAVCWLPGLVVVLLCLIGACFAMMPQVGIWLMD